MNKKECEEACLYLLNHCYEERLISDGMYRFTPSGFKQCEIFKKLIEESFNPQPYKFKDLKECMWVFDIKNKACRKIIGIYNNRENLKLIEFDDGHTFEFEENRFYPVTKAICEVNER